ncbi:MAG: hypothetical protein J1E40_00420 [Oscillospiraceae bacterium]|nr:hypothetical protein [Oscillospiraceae bacterium]
MKYGITAVLLMAAFTAGFITVYVNTYNIMHEEKMVVFDLDKTEDGTSITVLDHTIKLS